ncbi:MAG: MinD/ParA family protein [Proteobacteria bacterium]|nr:MinD/ParA family protein [Pseudomonadota bacterium]
MRDQAQGLRELAARARGGDDAAVPLPGRVLAVASGKGGVGKTSLVANLGSVLARRGQKVTVLDADFGLANLDILLNLNPARNLGHLLRGEARADQVVLEAGPGLRVIPGASGVQDLADLGGEERRALLASLAPLTGGQDFVLVDAAAGIGHNVVDLCRAAGEVLLVTNAEPTSLTDAYGLVKVVWARDARVEVRLVVNAVAGPDEGRAVHAKLDQVVARFLQRRLSYLGYIARDEHVARSAQRQTPFVLAYPRCPASRCVEALAGALLESAPPSADQGFWHRLLAAGDG